MGVSKWFRGFGWWQDETRTLHLDWLEIRGDPSARRPEDYFILWRWWWRLSWKWYILEVRDMDLDHRLVFRCNGVQRISKATIKTPYVAVRVGPQTTEFGLVNGLRESVKLTRVSARLSRAQLRTMTDKELAKRKGVMYYQADWF